jgi:hypothetical protein
MCSLNDINLEIPLTLLNRQLQSFHINNNKIVIKYSNNFDKLENKKNQNNELNTENNTIDCSQLNKDIYINEEIIELESSRNKLQEFIKSMK